MSKKKKRKKSKVKKSEAAVVLGKMHLQMLRAVDRADEVRVNQHQTGLVSVCAWEKVEVPDA